MTQLALLFSGQARTLDVCLSSIKTTFPTAEVFAHAYLDEDSSKVELLDPTRCIIEPAKEMPERKEYTWQVGRWCYGIQGMLKQLWSLKRVWEIYSYSNKKHKWIARCRYDVQYTGQLEDFWNWDCDLILPKHDNWWGINDRFAIMKYEVAEMYFTRLNVFDEYVNNSGMVHPETFLKKVTEQLNIARTNLIAETVRKTGEVVKPTYRADCGDIF